MSNVDLRTIQIAQLEILKDFAAFCDKNNLKYFICYGTLLGAVRHAGFIPWDDDIDVGMLREDYETFLKIAEKELDDKYYCLSWNHYRDYGLPFAKIKKRGTIYREEKNGDSKYNELFIDIFPFDNYPGTKRAIFMQGIPIALIGLLIRLKSGLKPYMGSGNRYKYILFEFLSMFMNKEWLQRKYRELAVKYNQRQQEYLIPRVADVKLLKWVIPRKVIIPISEIEFEKYLFKAPGKVSDFLSASYGDYMKIPPKGQRENQHRIIECKL